MWRLVVRLPGQEGHSVSTDQHPAIIPVADNFWNIRGAFRIAGLLNVGTQISLVRLASGKFVFLDVYTLDASLQHEVDQITGGKSNVEAILNLHPFHTLHVEAMARLYPEAKLYGTERHHRKFPDLGWQPERTENGAFDTLFSDDFDFTVPAGVDFIPANENLHFASVIAIHKQSKTMHVDDTLMYLELPRVLRWVSKDVLRFHPTLAKVLQPRAGAVTEFRDWAHALIERSESVENMCSAHMGVWCQRDHAGELSLALRIRAALELIEPKLVAHEKRYG